METKLLAHSSLPLLNSTLLVKLFQTPKPKSSIKTIKLFLLANPVASSPKGYFLLLFLLFYFVIYYCKKNRASVMKGYYGKDTPVNVLNKEGWLATSFTAKADEEGNFYLV